MRNWTSKEVRGDEVPEQALPGWGKEKGRREDMSINEK